jgi:tRNA nucleotidyltransferase (CCA-adding enzyme)
MVAARKLYPGAHLVLPGGGQEAVRSFMAVHDLGVDRLKTVDLTAVSRLICVDTQDPERIGPLAACWADPKVTVHVYDHHPGNEGGEGSSPGTAVRRPDLAVVEPVGATTTVMVEQLQAHDLALTPFEATVLAIGLYEETGSLAFYSTTPRDLEAGAYLLRAGADLNVVNDTLRRPLNPTIIALLDDLLRGRETFYVEGCKVLLATCTVGSFVGDLAELAHRLAELEGVDAVIIALAMEGKVELIGRSRRPEIDVGALAREFGGGGHPEAAAACVKGQTLVEVRHRLVQWLTERYRPTLLARDVMTIPVKSVESDATIEETETLLTKYGVNVLPVLDRKDRYHGVVSRETVQKALFHKLGDAPVGDFARSDQYTAAPDTPFRDIEAQMIERNQRFVPILSESKVVGVITRTDLLRTLHDDVLAAAHARSKNIALIETWQPSHGRNLKQTLRDRLPASVFALLKEAGELADRQGVGCYIVGGFVRDLLLGIENLDLDLVVEGDGIAFARGLAKQRGGHVKVHDRFGTAIIVLPDNVRLDVATARTEYYEYPTALPTVERSSIKKDLYRRDFTINTLAIRLNAATFGRLIDFYGGHRDLKERTIRVLHSLSFVEDPTRVFRAIRFELRFRFTLGKETLALIRGAAKMDLFHRLSGHRLLEELRLLFLEREPRKAVQRLGELDLLRFIHPKLTWSSRLESLLIGVEEALDWYRLLYLDRKLESWLVYLLALAEAVPDGGMTEILKRFSFSEHERETLKSARELSNRLYRQLSKRPAPTPAEIYRLLTGVADEALVFLMAKSRSEAVKREVSAFLTTYQHVKPSLTGDDLKAMGLRPGPLFRTILDRLLDARLNKEVKSADDERRLVEQLVGRR